MSAIKSLLCNALDAIAQHNDLDTAEAQLRLALTAVLDLKAQRALQSNRHDHALAHANALIALFPSSPEGYYRKGDVLFEKLDYKQACRLYTTCLHLCQARKRDVAPLQSRLEDARKRLNRKVDPWLRLPNELIESVFAYCPGARFTCLAVCKAWRHKLLNVGMLWQNLSLTLQSSTSRAAPASTSCKYLGRSLRHLTIQTDRTLCSALTFLLNNKCTHIERLTINDTSSYAYPPDGILQWPGHIDLPRLSGHLTELVIQSNAILKNSLCFIIASCPKLVKLAYRIVDEDEEHSAGVWQGRHATLSQPTPLRHVEWPLQEEILEKSEFIFEFCPQLQVLRIWPSIRGFSQDVSAFVDRLQRRCPALEQLILHKTADYTPLPIQRPIRPLLPSPPTRRTGLTNLSLGSVVFLRDHDILRRLIVDSASTLEQLDLARPLQQGVNTTESRSSLIPPLAKLQHFSLADQVPPFMQPFQNFLNGCQHLHTLQLRHLTLTVPIMDALLQLPLLHTVSFQYCSGGSHVYNHFAEGAAALGDACPLRSLYVEDWGKAPHVLLEPLSLSSTGKLRTLQHLVLFARYGEGFFFESMDWQMFISNARRSGLTSRLLTLQVDANERIYTRLSTSFIANVTYRVRVPNVELL
ncbi:hypothetical protein BCR43DRAFT_562916 [Syncephalastrum racemosum]|uniref:Uncharacterized protein n=1 Tax=Syncephalastrum racemosum TaxID=13706 RepID=A0A1X2HEU6_SYNRA|nr:hypothetical protein BCR43DRAFT_562916 [Syncephalastrum racemosum]